MNSTLEKKNLIHFHLKEPIVKSIDKPRILKSIESYLTVVVEKEYGGGIGCGGG